MLCLHVYRQFVKRFRASDLARVQSKQFYFVTVRNPWKRLVSAYVDKVLGDGSYVKLCAIPKYHAEFDRWVKTDWPLVT